MVVDHEGCVLAIVGSRDVPDYQAESIVKQTILEHKPKAVISGGARGVDKLGVKIAHELKVPTIEFLPITPSWDAAETGEISEEIIDNGLIVKVPGGFKQRNTHIAEGCDCLVRIASSTTKTYGSGWTADLAERLGKHVIRHTV